MTLLHLCSLMLPVLQSCSALGNPYFTRWPQRAVWDLHRLSSTLSDYTLCWNYVPGLSINARPAKNGLRFRKARMTTIVKNSVSVEDILSRLHGVKLVGDNQWQSLCPVPAHDDHRPSFHIALGDDSRILMHCKSGCSFNDICQALNIEPSDMFSNGSPAVQQSSPKKTPWVFNLNKVRSPSEEEIFTFAEKRQVEHDALCKFQPYADQHKPLILVPAYNPSEPAKPCGLMRLAQDGGLVLLGDGRQEKTPMIGKHGLLGVPWLINESPDTIIFTEGFRDALAAIALGFYATASSGGASCFKKEWLPLFKDKIVFLCFDRDQAGQKALHRAAKEIANVAKAVYIVNLPYEVTESHGKDLHDYLVGDKGDLKKLLKEAKVYEPSKKSDCNVILLTNDESDTVAEKINEYCRIKLNTIYHYNSIDRWSKYEHNRYHRIEDEKEIDILIRQCLRKCLIEVREKQEDGSFKVKYKPLKRKSQRFVSDVKGFWTSLDGVYLKPDRHAPESLDGRSDPAYVLPLKNGLLDFSVYPYQLYPHTPEFYTFNYLDFDWLGEKDSHKWINFLVEVTSGDEERFLLLQQWAGYTLLRSMVHQKFLLCFGDGANGKSVFFDIIMAMLGPKNCSTVPLSKFTDIHHLTQTYGKLANITDESSKGLEEEAETALKQYTGGTQVTFKRLYQQPFSAYPTAKIMIATNKLPRFVDTSNGIWRRMLLVPFDAVIPEGEQNKHLAEEIKATEMSGVLKWALEGLRSLEEMGGFIEPKACKQALGQYKRQMNPLIVFLEQNFESTNCDLDKVETKQLRKWYEQWCTENGYRPKNDTNVGIEIKKLWPYAKKKRMRQGVDRIMYYTRLKLKNDSEFNNEV